MLMKEQVTGLPRVTNPCTKRSPRHPPKSDPRPAWGRRDLGPETPHTHAKKEGGIYVLRNGRPSQQSEGTFRCCGW